MPLHESLPQVLPGGSLIAKVGAAATLAGILKTVAVHVPAGMVGVRMHSGQPTRLRDSYIVPEWTEGTMYGRYNSGWHVKPPGLHDMQLISVLDRIATVGTQITKPHKQLHKQRTYDVAATIAWGVPAENDPKSRWYEADVCYDSILLRGLYSTGEKLNDIPSQNALVHGLATGALREVLLDYKDPTAAKSEDVYAAMHTNLQS